MPHRDPQRPVRRNRRTASFRQTGGPSAISEIPCNKDLEGAEFREKRGLSRAKEVLAKSASHLARHARPCAGHPRLRLAKAGRTWMAGTPSAKTRFALLPAMTKEQVTSIRADHLEHVFRLDLEIVAAAAGTDDRVGEPGLVNAILDEGLIDVHGDDLAQRQ